MSADKDWDGPNIIEISETALDNLKTRCFAYGMLYTLLGMLVLWSIT